MTSRPLIIGSRNSRLALWQSNHIKAQLEGLYPNLPLKINTIRTTGDRWTDAPLHKIGGKGVFTKEIEEALLKNEIDLAVHSLKDLPTTLPEGLCLGAITKRDDPRDAFLSNQFSHLSELPPQSTVGTSSLRRQSQLLHFRPDLTVKNLRGNLDSRLRKLDQGDYDGIILACAGLIRLDLDHRIRERIPMDQICSAIGQGSLAIEVRSNDQLTLETIRSLEDRDSRLAAEAERALLTQLGGGCQVPIAGFAYVTKGQLHLTGLVGSIDGTRVIRESEQSTTDTPEKLGILVAQRLLRRGADEILGQME